MNFKRIKLIYILMPLFLIVIVSCEKQTKNEAPPILQEVVTMKIPPIEKQPDKAESGEQSLSLNMGGALPDASGAQVVPGQEVVAQTDSGSKVDTGSNSDSLPEVASITGVVPSTGTEIISQTGSVAPVRSTEADNKADILPDVNPAKADTDITKVVKTHSPSDDLMTGSIENKALLPAVDIDGQIREEKLFYIAKGKIDPFEPLIKEKPPVEVTQETSEEDIPQRILTPLEKLDFGQMKLVAILTRESGSVAMVQEATGKGYIVNIGTYIGRNSGQIVSIEKDKLVIQEKVKDYKGNVVDRFQELKLNKLEDKG
ncbi:MAG: pilus assembly protein PilP [Desulfamplus sp.]|nr:pilus assembly protein PilP [Desulfamplus sp.]